jgi:hypothetical protein
LIPAGEGLSDLSHGFPAGEGLGDLSHGFPAGKGLENHQSRTVIVEAVTDEPTEKSMLNQ